METNLGRGVGFKFWLQHGVSSHVISSFICVYVDIGTHIGIVSCLHFECGNQVAKRPTRILPALGYT